MLTQVDLILRFVWWFNSIRLACCLKSIQNIWCFNSSRFIWWLKSFGNSTLFNLFVDSLFNLFVDSTQLHSVTRFLTQIIWKLNSVKRFLTLVIQLNSISRLNSTQLHFVTQLKSIRLACWLKSFGDSTLFISFGDSTQLHLLSRLLTQIIWELNSIQLPYWPIGDSTQLHLVTQPKSIRLAIQINSTPFSFSTQINTLEDSTWLHLFVIWWPMMTHKSAWLLNSIIKAQSNVHTLKSVKFSPVMMFTLGTIQSNQSLLIQKPYKMLCSYAKKSSSLVPETTVQMIHKLLPNAFRSSIKSKSNNSV